MIYSLAAFLFAVVCFTIASKFAKAYPAFVCLWKAARVATSSTVILLRVASVFTALLSDIKRGVKLGMSEVVPVGKAGREAAWVSEL